MSNILIISGLIISIIFTIILFKKYFKEQKMIQKAGGRKKYFEKQRIKQKEIIEFPKIQYEIEKIIEPHVCNENNIIGICSFCGNFICEDCKIEIENKNYCKECVPKFIEEKNLKIAALENTNNLHAFNSLEQKP